MVPEELPEALREEARGEEEEERQLLITTLTRPPIPTRPIPTRPIPTRPIPTRLIPTPRSLTNQIHTLPTHMPPTHTPPTRTPPITRRTTPKIIPRIIRLPIIILPPPSPVVERCSGEEVVPLSLREADPAEHREVALVVRPGVDAEVKEELSMEEPQEEAREVVEELREVTAEEAEGEEGRHLIEFFHFVHI